MIDDAFIKRISSVGDAEGAATVAVESIADEFCAVAGDAGRVKSLGEQFKHVAKQVAAAILANTPQNQKPGSALPPGTPFPGQDADAETGNAPPNVGDDGRELPAGEQRTRTEPAPHELSIAAPRQ